MKMSIIILNATYFAGNIDNKDIASGKIQAFGDAFDATKNTVTAQGQNQGFGHIINTFRCKQDVFSILAAHGNFPVQVTADIMINKKNEVEIQEIMTDFKDLTLAPVVAPKNAALAS